jgi:hypothetical protein
MFWGALAMALTAGIGRLVGNRVLGTDADKHYLLSNEVEI